MNLVIKGGHIVDPKNNVDEIMDLLVEKGRIARLDKSIRAEGAKVIDAEGKIVLPGLIDMHAHLRQPGREDEETLLTGSRAAARGGFTTVLAMPNTNPVIDNRGLVEWVLQEASKVGLVNILPIGAITRSQGGRELAEMGELKTSGVLAISDDGLPLSDSELMRRALDYAKMFDLLIISHCEDLSLSADGVMNEGFTSTVLGFSGAPFISETVSIAREIELARYTDWRIHIAHITSARSIELITRAKAEGIKITCETCPHYFTLTEEAVRTFNTNTKVNPPLRTKKDVEAIKKGLAGGIIDVIATDHAPHIEAEKDVEFDLAPPGIVGLETALSLAITFLIDKNVLDWTDLVERMSLNPAKILKLKAGSLDLGEFADITIVNPYGEWIVEKEGLLSKSKNSPFIGWKLKGVVEYTICRGRIVYKG